MPTLLPITKPEFLAAFKTCDKYLKSNFIEQERFFDNMVCAMGITKQYLPDKISSTSDFFDEVTFRKVVVSILKTLGPEYWRHYENMSEQMRAEANSHFFAAGTDAVGIALGAIAGKVIKPMTKNAVRESGKIISRLSRQEAKKVTEVATKASTKNNGVLNRLGKTNGNRLEITEEGEAVLHLKTRHTNMGRDINPRKFADLRTSKDSNFTIVGNPLAVGYGKVIGKYLDAKLQEYTIGERFSFSDHFCFKNKIIDIGTDFVPILGNSKAAVSALTNFAIGRVFSKSADRIAEIEKQIYEADQRFFNSHLFVDIEKDLNAMDKSTLYRMWLFASSHYNQLCTRK